jgi:hypothetical protein
MSKLQEIYNYHFIFTDFNDNKGTVVKAFETELNDDEIIKEIQSIVKENKARSVSLNYVEVKNT